jgi:hypothetical protein
VKRVGLKARHVSGVGITVWVSFRGIEQQHDVVAFGNVVFGGLASRQSNQIVK